MGKTLFQDKIEIDSSKNSIRLVEPFLFKMKEAINMGEEKFYSLMLSVTEAVNNGIHHGNKAKTGKIVTLEASADEESVYITACDQGEGFKLSDVKDPTHPDNRLRTSGRGVFLIQNLMDFASWESSPDGTTVKMQMKYK